MIYHAKSVDIDVPLLRAILRSNDIHIQRALKKIADTGHKRIGILGLSFKAGTDDLRESPMVALTEALIGKGFEVRVYDRNVFISRLTGANRRFIEREIPHISSLLIVNDLDELIQRSEVVVIGNNDDEFRQLFDRERDVDIIDLVENRGRSATKT